MKFWSTVERLKIELFSKMFYKSLFYLQHLEVILLIQTKHIITAVLIFRKYINFVRLICSWTGLHHLHCVVLINKVSICFWIRLPKGQMCVFLLLFCNTHPFYLFTFSPDSKLILNMNYLAAGSYIQQWSVCCFTDEKCRRKRWLE